MFHEMHIYCHIDKQPPMSIISRTRGSGWGQPDHRSGHKAARAVNGGILSALLFFIPSDCASEVHDWLYRVDPLEEAAALPNPKIVSSQRQATFSA